MGLSSFHLQEVDINQKYQLLAKIGSGGMGDVYLAIQRGAIDFNRLVVIKRIHDRQVHHSEEVARMFINEASVVASLNHPHIVKVFDFYMAGASVCIVMEYVEGETLKYVLKQCSQQRERIPLGVTARLMLDACNSLHYAHNSTSPTGDIRKIVHRDIGLHNLMLDSNGYLKVIDFGIAKSDVQTNMTSPGLIKGNPGYMAPDIFSQTDPDHRIDIYALGLCLYEMATQTRAFKFSSSASIGEIVQEISKRELPFPSQIRPDLPPGLDDVVFKAIEKDRTKRYQTIEAFAKDLKKVAGRAMMSGEEVKDWFTSRFSSRLKERRMFGAQMLELARNTEAAKNEIPNFTSKAPSAVYNFNSLTPSQQQDYTQHTTHVSQVVIDRSNVYKIIGAMFLFFTAMVAVLYFAAFSGRSSAEAEKVVLTDNLVISSTPVGATLMIDGKPLAVLGQENLALRVEPNKEHRLVIAKEGYRDFVLSFVGPEAGAKRIDASLIKIAAAAPTDNTPNASAEFVTDEQPEVVPEEVVEDQASTGKRRYRRSSKRRSSGSVSRDRKSSSSKKSGTEAADEGPTTKKKSKIPLLDDVDKHRVPLVDDVKVVDPL